MAQELISADKIILPHQQRVIDEEKELNDKVEHEKSESPKKKKKRFWE